MKRISVLVIAAIFAAGSVLYAQPKLEIVGGKTYNWGKISPKDSPLKAKVELKNSGSEELVISKVKPGCGCTTAPLDKEVDGITKLSPGESTIMSVSLNVNKNSSKVTKNITITSNDPANAKTIMYLKAEVVVPLRTTPGYLQFASMEIGKKATAKVRISNSSKVDVKLSDIKATNGVMLSVKNEVLLKAGTDLEIQATAVPEKSGYFNTSIELKTDHPEMPDMSIRGFGQVKEAEKSTVFKK